jgi:hypothetical protein
MMPPGVVCFSMIRVGIILKYIGVMDIRDLTRFGGFLGPSEVGHPDRRSLHMSASVRQHAVRPPLYPLQLKGWHRTQTAR